MDPADYITYEAFAPINGKDQLISFGLIYHPAEPATHEDRASEAYMELVSACDNEGLDVLKEIPSELFPRIEREAFENADF